MRFDILPRLSVDHECGTDGRTDGQTEQVLAIARSTDPREKWELFFQ